jgi:PAP2 superfamily
LINLPVYYPILETVKQSFQLFWRFLLLSVITVVISTVGKAYHSKSGSGNLFGALRNSKLNDFFYWLELLRITVALIITSIFHFLLKSAVYLVNPRTWDTQLFRFDQSLHFGISPSLFFVELFKSPYFYRAMDLYYAVLYGIIVITYPSIFVAIAEKHFRRTFATAFVLVMILGWVGYASFPSWGPVFVHPEDFEASLHYMPLTVKIQSQLYKETFSLVHNPMGKRSIVYGGIAAFPSLHVAILTLFALVSRTISRTWFRINILFVILMMLGSVVTGYHYLIDAYVGVVLGWGVFKIGDFWVTRWEKKTGQEEEAAVVPA